ncbi:MAG: SDR family NAD(P)-dependent oxidoreductase, partial [Actinobacteria bacterium]|nr:SDR family NAD(P)-dependent oxidoreductase [Actinomycetota bacterium]
MTNTKTSDLFSLSGKVVLVTGGAGLLGQVFCQAFADSGAQVAVVDIDQPAAKSVAGVVTKKSGQKVSGFGCDITSPESVEQMVAAVVSDFGRIDVLVNNAASKGSSLDEFFKPFEEYSLQTWREVM